MNREALMTIFEDETRKDNWREERVIGFRLFIDVLNYGGFALENYKLNEYDMEYDKYWHSLNLSDGTVFCSTSEEIIDSDSYFHDYDSLRREEIKDVLLLEKKIQEGGIIELSEEDFVDMIRLGMGEISRKNCSVNGLGFRSELKYNRKEYYAYCAKPLGDLK